MSKRLTLKQLKFIQIYIETGNATKAAMEAYRCKNLRVAAVLGSENLIKPKIAREIEKYRKEGGLSIQKAINAINDAYDAEKKGGPDHNVRLRSADMTLKLADAYPRNKEESHRHAHLHLEMVNELAKLSFDELTQMMEKEAGLGPGALGPGTDIDLHALLSPEPAQQEPVKPNKKTVTGSK